MGLSTFRSYFCNRRHRIRENVRKSALSVIRHPQAGALSHVQWSDSRARATQVRQLGSRSAVSLSAMAANLRVLEVTEIKTVPYVPVSHPFIERLIGTIRRECLDRTLFWTARDLEAKLLDFQRYFNEHRTHSGLNGRTPETNTDGHPLPAGLGSYEWKQHCRGLYQTPMAA